MKIVEFKTKDRQGLFIPIPYMYKNFKIKQYSRAGTYVMETDSNGLNHWKINIPRGNYEIIGRSNELEPELIESKIGIPYKEYIGILNEKDITVNYSDRSDFWLVVLQLNNKMIKFELRITNSGVLADVSGTPEELIELISTVMVESDMCAKFILAATEVYQKHKNDK